MKKIFKPIILLFKGIYNILDKIIITPISKLIYKINEFFKNNSGKLEKYLNRPNILIYLSLICAFAIFMLIDGQVIKLTEKEAKVINDQPIKVVYADEAYVVEGVPEAVDITLIGEKSSIYLADQIGNHEVILDLTGYGEGTYKVKLKYNHSVQSVDYKLDPSTVTVKISTKTAANRNLQYDLMNENKLDSKLSIAGVDLETNEVVVKSNQEILDSVASVKALIDATQIDIKTSGDFDIENIPLVAYDQNGNKISNIEIVPSKIKATVKIDSYSAVKSVKVTTTGEMQSGKSIASIASSKESVTIYGEKSIVDAIDYVEATVDISGLKENAKITTDIVRPAGVRYMTDNKTEVSITVGEETQKTFTGIAIETVGLGAGLSASAVNIEDKTVDVILKGVSTVLDGDISNDKIKAYVDLNGLKAGTYTLPVVVKVDDNKVRAISSTKEINVEIVNKK